MLGCVTPVGDELPTLGDAKGTPHHPKVMGGAAVSPLMRQGNPSA